MCCVWCCDVLSKLPEQPMLPFVEESVTTLFPHCCVSIQRKVYFLRVRLLKVLPASHSFPVIMSTASFLAHVMEINDLIPLEDRGQFIT